MEGFLLVVDLAVAGLVLALDSVVVVLESMGADMGFVVVGAGFTVVVVGLLAVVVGLTVVVVGFAVVVVGFVVVVVVAGGSCGLDNSIANPGNDACKLDRNTMAKVLVRFSSSILLSPHSGPVPSKKVR